MTAKTNWKYTVVTNTKWLLKEFCNLDLTATDIGSSYEDKLAQLKKNKRHPIDAAEDLAEHIADDYGIAH